MIVLATDFGPDGPYTGQIKAVLHQGAPGVPVIDLFSDFAPWNVTAAAYLLAAYGTDFAPGTVVLAMVDPGVGGDRLPAVVDADGRWFVGPHNGLFELVVRRAKTVRWWDISWTPERLSPSFHGRDLFAPVAARLAVGGAPPGQQVPVAERRFPEFPDDLAEIVYVDRFGNGITGVRASTVNSSAVVKVGETVITPARTFSDVEEGALFWYENANGLVEIAANRARADRILDISVGSKIEFQP